MSEVVLLLFCSGLRQALHQSPGTSPRNKMAVSPASSENNLKSSSSRTSSQGSLEGVIEERNETEKIPPSTGMVRRRPSFERVKRGNDQPVPIIVLIQALKEITFRRLNDHDCERNLHGLRNGHQIRGFSFKFVVHI